MKSCKKYQPVSKTNQKNNSNHNNKPTKGRRGGFSVNGRVMVGSQWQRELFPVNHFSHPSPHYLCDRSLVQNIEQQKRWEAGHGKLIWSCGGSHKSWPGSERAVCSMSGCRSEIYCTSQHTQLTLRTILDQFILNVTYERSHLWHLIWLTVSLWAIACLGAGNDMYSEINTCLPKRSLCLASSFFFIFCWYFQCSRYVCSNISWLM